LGKLYNYNRLKEIKYMNIQQITDELTNIKEQAINDNEITKNSIVEAITDLLHNIEGYDYDFDNLDDLSPQSEEIDFSSLSDFD